MSYFEIMPKGFEGKDISPIERAISIAEYCGKYECFIPTGEAGVNDLWRLGYDGNFIAYPRTTSSCLVAIRGLILSVI